MATGLDIFDTTLQETNLWLKDLMKRLDTEDRQFAYRALRAVLHVVRDRIGPENAVHLAAQLPMLIRGFYFEGWRMARTPTNERHKQDFIDCVSNEAHHAIGVDPELAVRAVLEVMCDKIDPGEINKLIKVFPEKLRDLWPAARVVMVGEEGKPLGWQW